MKDINPKRILQVSVSDIGFGGAFAFVMNVMRNINKDRIIFDFCPAEQMTENSEADISRLGGRIFYINKDNKKNKIIKFLIAFSNYASLIKSNSYTDVHIHSDLTIKLFLYSLISKLCGVKQIILHSHSINVDGSHRNTKKALHYFLKPLLKLTGTQFIACSDLAAKWMYTSEICRNHIQIVNNGIDANKYKFDLKIRREYRNKLKIDNKFVIGNIARFAHSKNTEYLIDIFFEIYQLNRNAILLLIGEGELEKKIRHKVNQLGLKDFVIFYGTTTRIPELLNAMDVFVLPSRFEGLGIVLIEAQATGLKCFTSSNVVPFSAKVTDLLEFISLNDTPSEWAKEILKHTNNYERKNMYDNITKANFDIHFVAKQMEQIYLKSDSEL